MTGLILRPLTVLDETQARAAQAELARDAFDFLLGESDDRPWAEVVARFAEIERGENLTASLVTCDDTNVASIATIDRCGGVFESIVEDQGLRKRRYWVPTGA